MSTLVCAAGFGVRGLRVLAGVAARRAAGVGAEPSLRGRPGPRLAGVPAGVRAATRAGAARRPFAGLVARAEVAFVLLRVELAAVLVFAAALVEVLAADFDADFGAVFGAAFGAAFPGGRPRRLGAVAAATARRAGAALRGLAADLRVVVFAAVFFAAAGGRPRVAGFVADFTAVARAPGFAPGFPVARGVLFFDPGGRPRFGAAAFAAAGLPRVEVFAAAAFAPGFGPGFARAFGLAAALAVVLVGVLAAGFARPRVGARLVAGRAAIACAPGVAWVVSSLLIKRDSLYPDGALRSALDPPKTVAKTSGRENLGGRKRQLPRPLPDDAPRQSIGRASFVASPVWPAEVAPISLSRPAPHRVNKKQAFFGEIFG